MAIIFHPRFTGSFTPAHLSQDFIVNLAERLGTGLFPTGSHRRNQYEIETQSEDCLRFRSTNLLSGINIGLNDVSIKVNREKGEVNYRVTYWIWSKFCIGLGLIIAFFLVTGRYLLAPISNFDQYADIVFWPSVIFWCVIWPWLLIPIHKGSARKCLNRILNEVNSSVKVNT